MKRIEITFVKEDNKYRVGTGMDTISEKKSAVAVIIETQMFNNKAIGWESIDKYVNKIDFVNSQVFLNKERVTSVQEIMNKIHEVP